MSGILARIKALFAPSRSGAPPQELEPAPAPAATAPEPVETTLPEPITVVEESPPAEEVPVPEPVARAEVSPRLDESPPPLEEVAGEVEVAAEVAEAPVAVAEAPPVTEEVPAEIQPMAPAATSGGLTMRLEGERGARSTFEVTKSGATIGRGPESTIQLADLSVSRKHAKITYRQGAYWLSDLGSMGGTWIDGTKLAAPRRVATGQTIDIGLCRLTVTSAGAEEESPVAKRPSHAASRR